MGTTAQSVADHHYVPRFYLNGFKDKRGVLLVYEKGAAVPRASSPKAEGSREDYYVIRDFGENDDSAEQMLGKVETLVAPIFHNLRRQEHRMSPQEVGHLFAFIALTFVRVPAYREFCNRMLGQEIKRHAQEKIQMPGVFEKFLQHYEAKSGRPLAGPDEVRETIMSGRFTCELQSAAVNLLSVFRHAQELGKLLVKEYGYDLYYAPQGSFYPTSDNPVVTIRPGGDGIATVGFGFGWPDTQVVFPINKRVCAILNREGKERKINATPTKFAQINTLLAFAAQKYLYAAENTTVLHKDLERAGYGLKYGENGLIPFELKP